MDLHLEMRTPAARAIVWWALTDPDALACWYAGFDGFVPAVGCRFALGAVASAAPGDTAGPSVTGEVLLADEPWRLVYRLQRDRPLTTVCWHLLGGPGGTVLRLDQTGFRGRAGMVEAGLERLRWRRRLHSDLTHLLSEQAAGTAPGGAPVNPGP